MSRRHTITKKQPENKFFCKLCLDNGLPMSVVTSHNVAGLAGKSCCPTKACLSCRKCGRTGHSIKYCTATSTTIQQLDKFLDKRCEIKAVVKPTTKTLSNRFTDLDDSSDESPRTPKKSSTDAVLDCPWAPVKAAVIKKMPKSWADWSDSEDEE